MKCPKCEGLGYREYEAGIIQVKCSVCNGTGVLKGSESIIPLSKVKSSGLDLGSITIKADMNKIASEIQRRIYPSGKEIDDNPSDSGDRQLNTKSPKPRKRKKRKTEHSKRS